nr:protein kinase family domain protein [Rhodococcus sp. JVH1]
MVTSAAHAASTTVAPCVRHCQNNSRARSEAGGRPIITICDTPHHQGRCNDRLNPPRRYRARRPARSPHVDIHRHRRPVRLSNTVREAPDYRPSQSGNISIPDVAIKPVTDDARERDGGCDTSYFRAIPFSIVRRVATINCTPFTTSLEVTECGSSGFVPVPPMSSPGINAPNRPADVVPHRSQSRTQVCRCRYPTAASRASEVTPRCVEGSCRTTSSDEGYDNVVVPGRPRQPTPIRLAYHDSKQAHLRRPHPRAPPLPTDRPTAPLRKRPSPLCLITSTTPPPGTGNTAPPAAAPTPTCSSPPTVNAATSAPDVSAPPNRSAKTAPYSHSAAPTLSPPPRPTASGVACPKPSAPATSDAPASQPATATPHTLRHHTTTALPPARARDEHVGGDIDTPVTAPPPKTCERISANRQTALLKSLSSTTDFLPEGVTTSGSIESSPHDGARVLVVILSAVVAVVGSIIGSGAPGGNPDLPGRRRHRSGPRRSLPSSPTGP